MLFFKKRHDHNYKVLACQNEVIKDRGWTHIIFQCSCGEWYVDTIPGQWSADEILLIR